MTQELKAKIKELSAEHFEEAYAMGEEHERIKWMEDHNRIRAAVAKLRDEARTNLHIWESHKYQERYDAYTRVLTLLDGEVTDGTTN